MGLSVCGVRANNETGEGWMGMRVKVKVNLVKRSRRLYSGQRS
jgi:hypothetical protein